MATFDQAQPQKKKTDPHQRSTLLTTNPGPSIPQPP